MEIIQIILLIAVLGMLVLAERRKGISLRSTRKVVLDSCALIDGRIIELNRLGFVPDELIVPDFVVNELQLLADGHDAHKRERARYGLDVVKELQNASGATVIIDDTYKGTGPTDDRLVALAKKRGASLYTTDYNLNKVADIAGVVVLNVNELAQELRPTVLPGERKTIKILQKGSSRKQGVGYLDDGTMVVVDDAQNMIQKVVEVEVTRMHQTMAGKMVFATLVRQAHRPQRKPKNAQVSRLKDT